MKRLLSVFLAFAMLLACQPVPLFATAQNTGEIAGTAMAAGKALSNMAVRLRNTDSGAVVANSKTNDRGEFRFTGLPVGNFVVEVIDNDGRVVATSSRVALVAGTMVVTGVSISSSAAIGAAAAGAAAAGGGFFTTTAGILVIAAAAGGVAVATVAAVNDNSPSR
jgi:hypothetical protein